MPYKAEVMKLTVTEYRRLRARIAFYQRFTCTWCKQPLHPGQYDLHHTADDSSSIHPDDLACVHRPCHEELHGRTLNHFGH